MQKFPHMICLEKHILSVDRDAYQGGHNFMYQHPLYSLLLLPRDMDPRQHKANVFPKMKTLNPRSLPHIIQVTCIIIHTITTISWLK